MASQLTAYCPRDNPKKKRARSNPSTMQPSSSSLLSIRTGDGDGDGDSKGDSFASSTDGGTGSDDELQVLVHEVMVGPIHRRAEALSRLLGMPHAHRLIVSNPTLPFALAELGVSGLQLLETLLRRFPDLAFSACHPQSGASLLHVAATIAETDGSRGLSVAHCLLKHGASPFARDGERKSVVHAAASAGNVAVLALLKHHVGADGGFATLCGKDNRDIHSRTPLLCAVRAGSFVCVRFLCDQLSSTPSALMAALTAEEDALSGAKRFCALLLAFSNAFNASLHNERRYKGQGGQGVPFKAALRCLEVLLKSMNSQLSVFVAREWDQRKVLAASASTTAATAGSHSGFSATAAPRPLASNILSPTRGVDVEGGGTGLVRPAGATAAATAAAVIPLASKLYSPSGAITDSGGLAVAASGVRAPFSSPHLHLAAPSPSPSRSGGAIGAQETEGADVLAFTSAVVHSLQPLIASCWHEGIVRHPFNVRLWHLFFHLQRLSAAATSTRSFLSLCTYSGGGRNLVSAFYLRLRDRNEPGDGGPLFFALRAVVLPILFLLVALFALLRRPLASLQLLFSSLYHHLDTRGARYIWPLMVFLGFYYVSSLLSPLLLATASNLTPWSSSSSGSSTSAVNSASTRLVDPRTNALTAVGMEVVEGSDGVLLGASVGVAAGSTTSLRFWLEVDALLVLFWTSGLVGSLCYLLSRWIGPGFVVEPRSPGSSAAPSPPEKAYRDGLARGIEPPSLQSGYCCSCEAARPMRSKHCYLHDRCVQRFDHCCAWLDVCIGLQNHLPFLVFLLSACTFALSWLSLFYLFVSAVPPADGREWLAASKHLDPVLLLESKKDAALSASSSSASSFAEASLWGKFLSHARAAPLLCFAGVQPTWMLAFALLLIYQQYQYLSRGLTMNEAQSATATAMGGSAAMLSGSSRQYLTNAATGRFANIFNRGGAWLNISAFIRSSWAAMLVGLRGKISGSTAVVCSSFALPTTVIPPLPQHRRLSSDPIAPVGVAEGSSTSSSVGVDSDGSLTGLRSSLPRITNPLDQSRAFSDDVNSASPAFVIGTPMPSSGASSASAASSVRGGIGFGSGGGILGTTRGGHQTRSLLPLPSAAGITIGLASGPEALRLALQQQSQQRARASLPPLLPTPPSTATAASFSASASGPTTGTALLTGAGTALTMTATTTATEDPSAIMRAGMPIPER